MKLSLGGLYPCAEVVRAVLSPVPGETKRILDIGCGSRIWPIEMAKEFPHVEVIGLDVPQAKEHWSGDVPPNCTFEGTDFQFAIPEKYIGSCDLIHLRFIASAVSIPSHFDVHYYLISPFSSPFSKRVWRRLRPV
jgi:trans-aconitate methyltransferase